MAKGYWVVHVDIHEPGKYGAYRDFVGPYLESRGGRFLTRGGPQSVEEGEAFGRTVVVEFDSYEAAVSAYRDPAYVEGRKLRLDIGAYDFVIVEGVDV